VAFGLPESVPRLLRVRESEEAEGFMSKREREKEEDLFLMKTLVALPRR
jgi:hypothetical protein